MIRMGRIKLGTLLGPGRVLAERDGAGFEELVDYVRRGRWEGWEKEHEGLGS